MMHDRSRPFIIAQLGQSLDGRIATETGHSKYINGDAGLTHLHRLRALCDAVIVGVGTAVADDPMLNVRLCEGDNPARVVIDPRGRLPISARLLRRDGARRIIVTAMETTFPSPGDIEIIRLPRMANGRLSPLAIRDALARRGLSRLLLEGGAQTISGFLEAGALDRLHMIVCPRSLSAPPERAQPATDQPDRPCAASADHGAYDRRRSRVDCDLSACREA